MRITRRTGSASATDPELVGFELDVSERHGVCMAADGGFADVGSGTLDFAAMFAHARVGGVRQWLVEHDSPADPFATARDSYGYLAALRY